MYLCRRRRSQHEDLKAVRRAVSDLRAIFTASDRSSAEALLRAVVARCQASTPKLAAWMEANVPEGLTVLMEISDEWEAGKAHFLQTKRGIIEPAKARYG